MSKFITLAVAIAALLGTADAVAPAPVDGVAAGALFKKELTSACLGRPFPSPTRAVPRL